jgi:hypothetical protein
MNTKKFFVAFSNILEQGKEILENDGKGFSLSCLLAIEASSSVKRFECFIKN